MSSQEQFTRFKDLWPLAGQISGHLFNLTRPVMNPLFEEIGLAERGLAFMLMQAGYFDPSIFSSKKIHRRFPYSVPNNWDSPLGKLAEKGLLSATGANEYLLTENGRSTLSRFLDAFRSQLNTIEVAVDLEKLAELLGRIIAACLNAPEPPGAWAIRHSRNIAPNEEATAIAKIDQFLDDLNAFRDDAHLAAFAPHNISGHGWELFSKIWRNEVKTAAEMAEKMSFRGHDEASYAAALDDLISRGWVKSAADGADLTEQGKEVREAVEEQTDRYFYIPWLVLNADETETLRELMTDCNGRFAQLVEAIAEPA